MTAPAFSQAAPTSGLPDPGLMEDDFGPDATQSAPRATPTVDDIPKTNRRHMPKPVADVIGSIGKNKQRGTAKGLRPLTTEDRDKLAALYAGLGAGVKAGAAIGLPVLRERTGEALADNAETCADAWMEMAAENNHVRRAILFLVEGGAWTKLLVAHMPILATLMPETPPKWMQDILARRMEKAMQDAASSEDTP